jgi:hypothetical protein
MILLGDIDVRDAPVVRLILKFQSHATDAVAAEIRGGWGIYTLQLPW